MYSWLFAEEARLIKNQLEIEVVVWPIYEFFIVFRATRLDIDIKSVKVPEILVF